MNPFDYFNFNQYNIWFYLIFGVVVISLWEIIKNKLVCCAILVVILFWISFVFFNFDVLDYITGLFK